MLYTFLTASVHGSTLDCEFINMEDKNTQGNVQKISEESQYTLKGKIVFTIHIRTSRERVLETMLYFHILNGQMYSRSTKFALNEFCSLI